MYKSNLSFEKECEIVEEIDEIYDTKSAIKHERKASISRFTLPKDMSLRPQSRIGNCNVSQRLPHNGYIPNEMKNFAPPVGSSVETSSSKNQDLPNRFKPVIDEFKNEVVKWY